MSFDPVKDLEIRIRNLRIELQLKQKLLEELSHELRWKAHFHNENPEVTNRVVKSIQRPIKNEFLNSVDSALAYVETKTKEVT